MLSFSRGGSLLSSIFLLRRGFCVSGGLLRDGLTVGAIRRRVVKRGDRE